jgi:Fe2+ transport system protein FeoA
MKTIYDMNIGDTSVIKSMDGISRQVFHRFLDLGIMPCAKVKLLNKINFNQLFIIEIEDVEICIRQKDAKNIQIGG